MAVVRRLVVATDNLHTFASESRATAKFDKNNFKHTDMADKKKSTVGDLKQDENNYRKHSEANKKKIKKSIDECGLGRSVVVDADDVLVAAMVCRVFYPRTHRLGSSRLMARS